MRPSFLLAAVLGALLPSSAPAQGTQRFAELGSCPTEAGTPILECRIGYRTFGRLNPRRDNGSSSRAGTGAAPRP